MHYIRFMRAPALSRSGKRLLLELVLTINTDLSDAFLSPAQPVEVMVYAEAPAAHEGGKPPIYVLAGPGQIIWRSGLRVLKPTIDVPASVQAHLRAGQEVRICASARSSMSASGVARIVASVTPGAEAEGQIMPAYFVLSDGGSEGRSQDDRGADVGIRRLVLDGEGAVEFEEELGESMARHIWDGGVIALCRMADACLSGAEGNPKEIKKERKKGIEDEKERSPCMSRFRELIAAEKHVNVLELGCGIGVLGVGLAAVFPRMRLEGHTCSILMTDLEDAERRARANMARLGSSFSSSSSATGPVELSYETLDWEDGRAGRLGAGARGRRWDLMMLADCTYNTDTLPALVGTLSALHGSNQGHEAGRASRLFLATKNRHDSERAVFGLLAGEGWEVLGREVLSLPVLGDEAQTVELYWFEKR